MGLAGLGSQTRPCLRVTMAIVCVMMVSIFYFFTDLSNITSSEFLWRSSNEYDGYSGLVFTIHGSFQSNVSEKGNLSVRDGYLVWSPNCRIPDIDPYHESIRQLIKKTNLVACSSIKPLTDVSDKKLILNENVIPQYSNRQKMSCCFQEITRSDKLEKYTRDNSFDLSPCHQFNKTTKLNENQEYILVKCTIPKRQGRKEVYANVHATIMKKPIVDEKAKFNSSSDKLSILFIGIDSVSRLNLLRTMPSTVSFLKDEGWIEMKGYNKIADNTFPNLVAIMTGMSLKQLSARCWSSPKKKLDECPFIWMNASREGYLTNYAEDEPSMSTFNFHKSGFDKSPTDYYFRPFMLAAEKYLKYKSVDGLKVCLGPTLTADHLLKYSYEFATSFKDTLYFALIWMNSFSHNNVNSPSSMDKRFTDFFQNLNKKNALNNTAVIFLSDHGMRFGKIRNTFVGWLEERLPFLYIWLPKWYRERHQTRMQNLLTNVNRLTSPYDLHLTIKDLIMTDDQNPNYTSPACPTCSSLFEQLPWDRSCNDAGVTEHWCTCSEYRTLSREDPLARAMVLFVINQLNIMLESGKNMTQSDYKCATLAVNRVLTVRSAIYEKLVGRNDYVIIFETLPGEALFEATIRHEGVFQLLDSVSRINAFGSQSKCMEDAYLKKYCYCQKQ